MIRLLFPALLAFNIFPAFPANAQEVGADSLGCFYGLSDSVSPATLPPCESPSMLNVESNLDGTAILKRKGYQLTSSLSVATSAVTGSHSFIDGSGNRQDIVCQDRMCLHSVNGNAFATFLSTAGSASSRPTRWSFVDVGGILYGANDRRDAIMRYDGTTRNSPPGMPTGSILEMTQDRMAVGDISGQPNRVHYSSAGAYEAFTVGVNPEDSYFDDFGASGDRIRGIKCISGNCYIFKSASITLCEMADQYNTQCAVISPNIGTTDPASIVAAGTDLYFRAQDKNYWVIDRGGLRQISKKIPNLVKSQSGGLGGGEQSNTQTSKADWDAGTQSPTGTWDTTTINGSISNSSTTATMSGISSKTWAMVDLDSTAYVSSFVDNFDDGDLTSGIAWTVRNGGLYVDPTNKWVSESSLDASEGAFMSVGITTATGVWSFALISTNTGPGSSAINFYLLSTTTNWLEANGYSYRVQVQDYANQVTLQKISLGVPSTMGATQACSESSMVDGSPHYIKVTRASNGFMTVSCDGKTRIEQTDTSIVTSTYNVIGFVKGSGSIDRIHISNIKFPPFYVEQVGTAYDLTYTVPTFGKYSVSMSSSGISSATFRTETSASGTGSWSGRAAVTSAFDIASPKLRYLRNNIRVYAPEASFALSVSSITMQVASTGTFTTQAIQPNTSISAWGTLSCAETKTGNGSLVYYATSAASVALLPAGDPTTWQTSVTNNSTLSISTNVAVKIGFRSLLGSATDQAQVDSCVLAWNEGTPSQPAWAVYDSVKNAVYWTSTVDGAASANRLLKYDRNLEQWYPFNIAAQAPRVINNSLYFGGASAGTWNLYGGVDSDAGSAINAYWKSRDIGNDPFRGKQFKTLSVLSRNQGTGSLTGTWTLSNSQTGSYTISLSTGSGITYARNNYNLPFASPQQFLNVQIGNNSATPFEVLGIGTTWVVSPWKVEGP